MKEINDLYLAHYDAKEVEVKKQSLLKQAAAAGGAIVLSLSLFNLSGCKPPIVAGGAGSWYHSCPIEECECTKCECTDDECATIVVGGAGAWYLSRIADEPESTEDK